MTSESLYAHMDADYSEALRRIGGNERMVKYLRIMDGTLLSTICAKRRKPRLPSRLSRGARHQRGIAQLRADKACRLLVQTHGSLALAGAHEAIAPLFKETKQVYQEAIARIDALPDDAEER